MSENQLILSRFRWPSIVQDLALMTVPGSPIKGLGAICQTYNLTEAELKSLLQVPQFKEMLKTALAEMQEQGGRGGARRRSLILSQALSDQLFRSAINGGMEAKDAIKFLELQMKSAGLLAEDKTQVNTQVNVGVKLPLPIGLDNPKLKHLEVANG